MWFPRQVASRGTNSLAIRHTAWAIRHAAWGIRHLDGRICHVAGGISGIRHVVAIGHRSGNHVFFVFDATSSGLVVVATFCRLGPERIRISADLFVIAGCAPVSLAEQCPGFTCRTIDQSQSHSRENKPNDISGCCELFPGAGIGRNP